MQNADKKILTLCCVYNSTHILLGEIMKEGKIKGMYNGFGGKVEEGETIEQAAKRELTEESGIAPLDMKKRGVLTFVMDDDGNPFNHSATMEAHVYSVTQFEGELKESREMRPEWFLHKNIPYDRMWPDDIHWLPLLLAGKNFEGTFHLKDPKTITKYALKEI
jgi:8-oxo-dGTP pyrophosphatase MutT (NUDIX family)